MSLRALAGCVLLALLAGCAPQPVKEPADWRAHVDALAAHPRWALQGKIGLRASPKSGAAFLSWDQDGERYRLVLSGALGLGRLVLEGDPGGVSWTGKDGHRGRHPDADALVSELWGWTVPVASLPWWVRGLPDPARPVEGLALEGGVALRFRQSGWTVEPSAFSDVGGLLLPARVRLEGASATLTVSINRWTVPSP